jgi:hypothetical protein
MSILALRAGADVILVELDYSGTANATITNVNPTTGWLAPNPPFTVFSAAIAPFKSWVIGNATGAAPWTFDSTGTAIRNADLYTASSYGGTSRLDMNPGAATTGQTYTINSVQVDVKAAATAVRWQFAYQKADGATNTLVGNVTIATQTSSDPITTYTIDLSGEGLTATEEATAWTVSQGMRNLFYETTSGANNDGFEVDAIRLIGTSGINTNGLVGGPEQVDLSVFPVGVDQVDIYLLLGQSNMKGRGVVPLVQADNPLIVNMNMADNLWYEARHPLHKAGVPDLIDGSDNAGVGPGLDFARGVLSQTNGVRIALVPCAAGGSWIDLWAPGVLFYTNTIYRAQKALADGPVGKTRIKGVLWLQGESDAIDTRYAAYKSKLTNIVQHLRTDLNEPDLPFIACTIGSFIDSNYYPRVAEINDALLSLPESELNTACVDARDLTGHIGDNMHYNTESQVIIGGRYFDALRLMNTSTGTFAGTLVELDYSGTANATVTNINPTTGWLAPNPPFTVFSAAIAPFKSWVIGTAASGVAPWTFDSTGTAIRNTDLYTASGYGGTSRLDLNPGTATTGQTYTINSVQVDVKAAATAIRWQFAYQKAVGEVNTLVGDVTIAAQTSSNPITTYTIDLSSEGLTATEETTTWTSAQGMRNLFYETTSGSNNDGFEVDAVRLIGTSGINTNELIGDPEQVDLSVCPPGVDQVDIYLLLGQSNMKGLAPVSSVQTDNPLIVNMNMADNLWYEARHPLHKAGVPGSIDETDNAGVGPGLDFARGVLSQTNGVRIALVPCAVNGSWIDRWAAPAGELYTNAIYRAQKALADGPPGKTRIKGVLWLQGESDAIETRYASYKSKLTNIVQYLRTDLNEPDLPFIACTIGSFIRSNNYPRVAEINNALLSLPESELNTACVDARDLTGHIGDFLHYNTASQVIIGGRYAEALRLMGTRASATQFIFTLAAVIRANDPQLLNVLAERKRQSLGKLDRLSGQK